jgi:hypothetical protein
MEMNRRVSSHVLTPKIARMHCIQIRDAGLTVIQTSVYCMVQMRRALFRWMKCQPICQRAPWTLPEQMRGASLSTILPRIQLYLCLF